VASDLLVVVRTASDLLVIVRATSDLLVVVRMDRRTALDLLAAAHRTSRVALSGTAGLRAAAQTGPGALGRAWWARVAVTAVGTRASLAARELHPEPQG
jgi:hypothetical protein